jgi:chromosomal replication initiation ATPase DnaA
MTHKSQIPNAAAIFRAVYDETGITPEQIMGKRRTDRIVYARHMTIAVLHIKFPRWSLTDLAEAVNRADHGTAINAIKRATERARVDKSYRASIRRILEKYGESDCQ